MDQDFTEKTASSPATWFRKSTPTYSANENTKPYKKRKSFAERKEEAQTIRIKFPRKIPAVLERYSKETSLPQLAKAKFLVPEDLTMSQFMSLVRTKLTIAPSQAFYLLVNNRSFATMSLTIGEVYAMCKDADGFLYMTYASQESFGA